jgi:hypothetical protein
MIGITCLSPPDGWASHRPPCGIGIDRSHPLAQGLLVALPCSDGAGLLVTDAAGRVRPAMSGTGPFWKPSPTGPALDLSGTGNYLTLTNNGKGLFSNQEISLFLDLTASDFSGWTALFSYDYTSHAPPYYSYHLRLTYGYPCFYWNDGSAVQAVVGTSLQAGRRTLVTAVYRSGRQEIWQDGIKAGSSARTDPISFFNQPAWIGKANFGGNAFTLHGAAAWSRSLSASEIVDLHAHPYAMYDAGIPFPVAAPRRPRVNRSLGSNAPLLGALA